jgi:hypothetical protein
MAAGDHTLGTWLYDVSEQVTSFLVAGFGAFVAAKAFKIGQATRVPWWQVIYTGVTLASLAAVLIIGTALHLNTEAQGNDPRLFILLLPLLVPAAMVWFRTEQRRQERRRHKNGRSGN